MRMQILLLEAATKSTTRMKRKCRSHARRSQISPRSSRRCTRSCNGVRPRAVYWPNRYVLPLPSQLLVRSHPPLQVPFNQTFVRTYMRTSHKGRMHENARSTFDAFTWYMRPRSFPPSYSPTHGLRARALLVSQHLLF